MPLCLKRASSFLEIDNLPHAQQYVQHSEAGDGAPGVPALHRKREPGPLNLIGGKHQQVILTPGRAWDPWQDNQQYPDLETDQDEEDYGELNRHRAASTSAGEST